MASGVDGMVLDGIVMDVPSLAVSLGTEGLVTRY